MEKNKALNAVNELIKRLKELKDTDALGYTHCKSLLCLANEVKGEIVSGK